VYPFADSALCPPKTYLALTASCAGCTALLIFPPAECCDLFRSQAEPLTFVTLGLEAPVPIGLDSRRIVGRDAMDETSIIRQLDVDLSLTTFCRVSFAKFVMAAVLDQVDIAGNWACALSGAGLGVLSRLHDSIRDHADR